MTKKYHNKYIDPKCGKRPLAKVQLKIQFFDFMNNEQMHTIASSCPIFMHLEQQKTWSLLTPVWIYPYSLLQNVVDIYPKIRQ